MKLLNSTAIGTAIICLFLSSPSLFSFPSSLVSNPDENPYLGRWALHLPEGAGWLEVRQEDGYLDADIMWRGGSVVPVSHVYMHEGKLVVTRTRGGMLKRENGRKHQLTAHLILEGSGDMLIGKMIQPQAKGTGSNTTVFHATRIPPLPQKPNVNSLSFGKAIKLFNGKDLEGWRIIDPHHANGWKAENGVLANRPTQPEGGKHVHYGNLRTEATFEDFNLTLKVNVPKGNNSGIYLKGIYEIQVFDSYGKDLDSHNMGALYSRITPSVAAEKKPGKWQDLDITLVDRHLTVILNGKTIIDNQPVMGVTGGAMTADEFSPGPLYLQGDHGEVLYKDLVLKPIIK